MARERHLSKAPIREAVLDLRVPRVDEGLLDQLRAAMASLETFGEIHEMRQGSVVFRFSPEGKPESRVEGGEVIGMRGTSEDGLWAVQFRLNGLTFSRLAPYSDWAQFSDRARLFVERFLDIVAPRYVERLALRYVNHFRLPYPGEMEEHFVGLPHIPAALPQFVSNLISRVTVHDPERDFSAHITHSLLDDLDPEKMGFILDIDAFRTSEFSPEVENLWETFDALRVFKNQIFFELITERNAELHT